MKRILTLLILLSIMFIFITGCNDSMIDEKTAPLNAEMVSGEADSRLLPPISITTLTSEVKTSNILFASTDATVKMRIHYINGNVEETTLTSSEDIFAQGQLDTFTRADVCMLKDDIIFHTTSTCTPEYKTITGIDIYRDNAGISPSWHLSYVKVYHQILKGYNVNAYCPYNSWVPANQWISLNVIPYAIN